VVLVRPSDRRMSAKLVTTFADGGCRVVNATDPHGRILGFLDRSRYYIFQVAPQLYSRGWVEPIPDPLHLRKSNGNNTIINITVLRDVTPSSLLQQKIYRNLIHVQRVLTMAFQLGFMSFLNSVHSLALQTERPISETQNCFCSGLKGRRWDLQCCNEEG
jgi:hypothetical protein